MTTLTRRLFMHRAAGVSALSASAVTQSFAGTIPAPTKGASASDLELDALWAERVAIVAEYSSANAAAAAATERLPEWAAPGGEYMDFEGNRCGAVVGWPEVEILGRASFPGAYRRIRVSPSDLKKDFERTVANFCSDTPHGQVRRAELRSHYRTRMRTFIDRRRQQSAEEAKLGLDELEARCDALSSRLIDVEIKILRLPQTPNATAAELLLRAEFDRESTVRELAADAESASMAVIALRGLRPFLTGAMLHVAASMLDNPDTPLGKLGLWVS